MVFSLSSSSSSSSSSSASTDSNDTMCSEQSQDRTERSLMLLTNNTLDTQPWPLGPTPHNPLQPSPSSDHLPNIQPASLVHVYVSNQDHERLNALLLQNTEDTSWLNERNAEGLTPLMVAIDNNDPHAVKLLLEADADLNLYIEDETSIRTLLHLAIEVENSDIVEQLLRAGIAVESNPSSKAGNPLHQALKTKNQTIIMLLIDHIESELISAKPAKHSALYTLISYRPSYFNQPFKDRKSAFQMAVDLDLLEAAERLIHIKKGISQNGHIVLHQTLEALKQNKHDTKSQKVFEILINSRINLSAHNQSGQSPLHFTIMHHLIEEGCALLEHLSPEEINHSNSNGITAVHQAVLSDNQALLDKLVAIQGIQLDSTDHSGDTPLITAITTDNIECAETLLDAGANIDQSDHTGDSPLHHALMVNDETFIALVLDYEPSLNNSNFRGFTPLHLAATMEQPDELYQLLNYIDSAEVLEQTTHDYDAFTALQLAVEHNLGSNVKALIEYGADHSVTDRDGKNLLNLALERRTQSSNSAFSALIGLNLTFPLRDDTENAHDANINHTFCIYLNRIKDEVEDSMHLSEEETLRELKERITAQDAHSALRVLASIEEEGNHPIAHLSSDQEAGTETERSVLSWVYSYIFTQPENQQAALIDSLITRLADGYDTEKQDIVCRNGKVNRILDTFTGILPGFSVVSIDLIRKEMIESAAHIREQMIKDQPHKVQRALTSKRTTQVQERVLERFQAALKERIKAQLFQTYVNGGILSEDRFNNLLKEWIDYIH